MKNLKEKELYGITVIEEKDLTEAELEGNDYPIVYLKEDVVLVVAELRKEIDNMFPKCKGLDNCQVCKLLEKIDELFGCEKPSSAKDEEEKK